MCDMKRIFMLIAILVAGNPVYARLGETVAEIESRYGKPVTIETRSLKVNDKSAIEDTLKEDKSYAQYGCITYYYSFNGTRTSVHFIDGVSVSETYWKMYSMEEIQALLNLNAKDEKWTLRTDAKDASSGVRDVRWTTSTNKNANYVEGDGEGVFHIYDKRFSDFLDKIKNSVNQKLEAEKEAIIKNNTKGY